MATTVAERAVAGGRDTADELRRFLESTLAQFPHRMVFTDWTGASYSVGRDEPHFCGEPLRVAIKTEAAAKDALALDGMRFLERFLEGEVDMSGNLYSLPAVRRHSTLKLRPQHVLRRAARVLAFQDNARASVSVKSHYDIPQEALNLYLDRVYMSYSCGMFERPDDLDIPSLLRVGKGKEDDWDSLEKAHWRKFQDAVDYIAPRDGETLLDVGCGYGGQLVVALESHPFGKVVGWTHSHNQATVGAEMLSPWERDRWELNEGDYRQDHRVFDHITSTGMISHVGPRGLVPYVKQVRKRIKTGGRYLHHALMTSYHRLPIDFQLGIAFNKKYVWPGFHWFTLGEHVRALEKNGFQVEGLRNLTRHYAKTTTAWYERMVQHHEEMARWVGEPTYRAWQIFLAGITGSYLERDVHLYRLYCVAT